MRLVNPELLASSMEDALGEYHWVSKNTDPHMRLRNVGVCGLVSAAIALNLDNVALQISTPAIRGDETGRHVVVMANWGSEEVIIDASYTQFLAYAGLTPGYVHFGGANTFPEQKIAMFNKGEHHETALQLARHARIAIDTYTRPDDVYYSHLAGIFETFSDEEIITEYGKIWNPENFSLFTISDEGRLIAEAMAARIPPKALELSN